jgi:hypothetical protein
LFRHLISDILWSLCFLPVSYFKIWFCIYGVHSHFIPWNYKSHSFCPSNLWNSNF